MFSDHSAGCSAVASDPAAAAPQSRPDRVRPAARQNDGLQAPYDSELALARSTAAMATQDCEIDTLAAQSRRTRDGNPNPRSTGIAVRTRRLKRYGMSDRTVDELCSADRCRRTRVSRGQAGADQRARRSRIDSRSAARCRDECARSAAVDERRTAWHARRDRNWSHRPPTLPALRNLTLRTAPPRCAARN